MALKPKPIQIVGCGPGSMDYLSRRAQKASKQAQVLAGAKHLLALFADHPGERLVLEKRLDPFLEQLAFLVANGKRVAVLVSGDPGLSSLAQPVVARFGARACSVIPGISSIQVAFARLALDWTNVLIVNAHGRSLNLDARLCTNAEKIVILLGGLRQNRIVLSAVGRLLDEYQAFVCANLTLDNESITELTMPLLAGHQLPSRALIVLLKRTIPL